MIKFFLGQQKAELTANTADAAREKHLPVVTVDGSKVTVTVSTVEHPSTEAHYIVFIVLETQKGAQMVQFKPGDKPQAEFVLDEGDSPIAAYEFCNLHGLWKTEI